MRKTSATQSLEIIISNNLNFPQPTGVTVIMTSFAIIAETAPKVNLKLSNNGKFTPLVETNTSSIVAAKRCENYDPSPYATNTWTASRMSFQWHGDDVASFDNQTHALISRDKKEAIFRPLNQPTTRVIMCADLLTSIIARTTSQACNGERVVQKKRVGAINPDSAVTSIVPTYLSLVAASFELQNFDFGSDPSLPLDAEQVLFCTSQLGAMGCSHSEVEQFFDDLLPGSPHWYPNFTSEAAKYDKSLDFLFDVCDAFVDSVTPVDQYVRIAKQLFRYKRDTQGYEFTTCVGSRGGEIVELIAYPHEVQQVKQELAWV